VTREPETDIVPFDGVWITLYVKASPSTSEPVNWITIDSSSSIPILILEATGASLTAFTVTVIFWLSDSLPSVTVTVNVSLPL